MKSKNYRQAYDANETFKVGDIASKAVETFLKSKPETIKVVSVENDMRYQNRGIDMIWYLKKMVKNILLI